MLAPGFVKRAFSALSILQLFAVFKMIYIFSFRELLNAPFRSLKIHRNLRRRLNRTAKDKSRQNDKISKV